MADRALTLMIFGEDKTASKTLGKVGQSAEEMSDKVKKSSLSTKAFGAAAGALAGIGLVSFMQNSVTAASDLNETVSKSQQIFGKSAGAVDKWGDTAATSVGLSKAAALDAAAGFGNMFTQLGYTSKAAADVSTKTVQMAADLGSFNNLPTADVADKISGALRGEYDSLQALIPNINAARVEQEAMSASGKTNAAELTAQEKAAAVLAIVQKDGATAMGDYARTADGLANSTKTATANFENQQAEIGKKLIPVWQGALSLFSDVGLPVLGGIADALGFVVGVVEKVPGPVIAAGAAIAAWKLLDGPIGAFLTNVHTKMKAISVEAPTMGAKAKLAGGAMLGAFGGPIGLAVTGLTLGIGFLAKKVSGTEIATHDFASAIDELTGAIDRAKVQDVVGGETLKRMQDAGVAAGDYSAALAGNADAIDRVKAALQGKILASQGDFDAMARATALYGQFVHDASGAAGATANWAAEQKEANTEVGKAPAPTKAAEDAAKKLRDEYNKTAYEAGSVAAQVAAVILKLDEVAGRNGDAEAAQRAFNGATRDYAAAQRDIPGATRDVEQAQADLAKANDALAEAQGKAIGKGYTQEQKNKDVAQASRDLATAQDGVTAAQAGVGAATDAAAQKSEDLRKNYLALGQGAFDQAMAQGNVAGATKAAEDAMAKAKDEWIKAQPEQDRVTGKAQAMAEKLFGIPTEVATTISATDNASRVAAHVESVLTTLDGKSATVEVYAQVKAQRLAGISDSFLAMLGPQDFHASGGLITGGIPGRDSVPGMLMPGELVLTTAEVERAGGQAGVYDQLRGGGDSKAFRRLERSMDELRGLVARQTNIENLVINTQARDSTQVAEEVLWQTRRR